MEAIKIWAKNLTLRDTTLNRKAAEEPNSRAAISKLIKGCAKGPQVQGLSMLPYQHLFERPLVTLIRTLSLLVAATPRTRLLLSPLTKDAEYFVFIL